jgi:hypothetical protein
MGESLILYAYEHYLLPWQVARPDVSPCPNQGQLFLFTSISQFEAPLLTMRKMSDSKF